MMMTSLEPDSLVEKIIETRNKESSTLERLKRNKKMNTALKVVTMRASRMLNQKAMQMVSIESYSRYSLCQGESAVAD